MLTTKQVAFFLDARPVPKQSFRASKWGGYQPKRVTDFKKLAEITAMNAAKSQGWETADGPVRLELVFCFCCPKSARKTEKAVNRWHTKRPDLDNIEKSITDGVACLMGDDSQVCSKASHKATVREGLPQGIWVRVSTLPPLAETDEPWMPTILMTT